MRRLIKQFSLTDSVPTEERRESVRLKFSCAVDVKVDEQLFSATLVNLTFTGLCLELQTPLEEGREVLLSRDEFGPPFRGTVLWSKKAEKLFLVGIECELDEDKLIGSWLEPTLIQAGFEPNFLNEKRQVVRVPGRVKCKLQSLMGESMGEAFMLDLSRGGALLESERELVPETSLKFETAALGGLPPLRDTAKIVSARSTDRGTWLCGVRFPRENEEKIQPYMDTMLATQEKT